MSDLTWTDGLARGQRARARPRPWVTHGGLARALRYLLAASVLLLVAAAPALATEGERELWLGIDAETTVRVGPSVQARYALTDFWALGGTVQHRLGRDGAGESGATADVRLTIDALTFVPSVDVGVGAATTWHDGVVPLARAGLALAWRPQRDHAWRLRVGVEQVGLDGAPRPFLSLSWGWIRSATGDLDF